MTALVLDSSAVVELLLVTAKGRRVEQRIFADELHLPEVCLVEVVSALRGLAAVGKVAASRAAAAVVDLAGLKAVRHSAQPLLIRMWQLRANLTAYDATYVALAERLNAALVTSDGKFDIPVVRRLITVEVIR